MKVAEAGWRKLSLREDREAKAAMSLVPIIALKEARAKRFPKNE